MPLNLRELPNQINWSESTPSQLLNKVYQLSIYPFVKHNENLYIIS